MKRFGPAEDDHYTANVWPAITDTVLLMASIFIVLSVVTMANMARKLHDYEKPSEGESQTTCVFWRLDDKGMFDSSDYKLKSGQTTISSIIREELAPQVESIRRSAEAQKWGDYYIVLEASGHADNKPFFKDGVDQNWYLSAARANSVIYFIENQLKQAPQVRAKVRFAEDGQPVPGSMILRAAGYSSHVPRTEYKNLKGKALRLAQRDNRRVEIRLFAQPVGTIGDVK